MKKALITGITGQDGSYLAELLLEKGYEVHGMVRRASISNTARIDHLLQKKAVTLHDGDLSDTSSITRIIQLIQPDEIYNLAAQSHVQVSFDVPEYSGDVDAIGVLRILEAVRVLARLHGCMELSQTEMDGLPADGFFAGREYEKHNRELRRVRKYLKQRGQKTGFEIGLLNSFDYFLEQALAVTEEWNRYRLENSRGHERKETVLYCHGDYQYHNILWGQEEWFVVNFEKCLPDNPIRDLYLFLRKLLEKSSWSVSLGKELLAAYQEERPISDESRMDLYYRLAYPEKFWKIVNFYYNSGKAWIPERNREKLEKLVVQEKEKQIFLDEIFQRR